MDEQGTNAEGVEGSSLPWQERERYPGPVQALWETVKAVLFRPSEAFAHIQTYGSTGSSMLYVVLLGTLGALFGVGWQWVMTAAGVLPLAPVAEGGAPPAVAEVPLLGLLMGMQVIVLIVLVPVIMVVGPIINAALLHVCLWLVGGAGAPFEGTYAVVAYGAGSTALLNVIPLCGGLNGGIWGLVIEVIGLREVHGTTTAKALIAVLLPMLLCCGAVAVFMALALFAAVAAGGAVAAGP